MQLYSHTLAINVAKLRQQGPFVQIITNLAAMDLTANVLLALGVHTIFIHAKEEVSDFVGKVQGLVVNIGNISEPMFEGMQVAVRAALEHNLPWVLDPTMAGVTPFRNRVIQELLEQKPQIIRANIPSTLEIAEQCGYIRKGYSGIAAMEDAVEAAKHLALHHGCVVAVTGATDVITDGQAILRLSNGSPLIKKVRGMGATLSAVMAAFLTQEKPLAAAAIGAGVFSIVAEVAAQDNKVGPGTFRTHFIDTMDTMDANAIMRRLKVIN